MSFYLFAIFIPIYVLFLWYRHKRARLYKLMELFDGPPAVPILGNVLDFKANSKEMFKYLVENYVKKFDKTYKVWLLHVPLIIVFKPEDIQILSSKNLEKDPVYEFIAELIGDGLITCSMKKWKRRRRIVNPAFQMPYLNKNVLGVFHSHYQVLTETLEKKCNTGEEFDIWPYIITATFGSICEATMGYTNYEDPAKMEKFADLLSSAMLLIGKRVYRPWLYPSIIFNIYKYLIGKRFVIEDGRSQVQQILKQRKMGLLPKKTDSEGNQIKDLVDMIGEASGSSKYLSESEVNDEVGTIILAGMETTAVTIASNFLMLAIKPDIQEKVFKELDDIFGDSDRMPTPEDLNKMVFLEQCLNETLRWVSMVGVLFRSSNEEIELSDGRVIPTGVKIVIASYMTHRDENIYPNPYTWNPDNFHPERVKNRHPYAFIPYGFGARMCLGPKYAMMSMKVLQSTVLRKYKLRSSVKEENIEMDYDFTLRISNGYPVELQYRKI